MRFSHVLEFSAAACLALAAGTLAAADDPHAGHGTGHEAPATGASHAAGAGHSGHEMEPWMYDELRKRVDIYQTMSDAEIDDSMVRMGPDYTSHLSPGGTEGPVGALVLAHGFGPVGDEAFRKGLAPIADGYPLSVAFGMSMTSSRHIQQALDELTAAGARTVVVVPALSSAASDDQLRQWQYMFGLTDDPGYMATPRVKTDAKLIWTPPLEDHPLVVDAIADHAREMSKDPSHELVVVVSHGPTAEESNRRNIALLERIAGQLQARDGYARVAVMSMQNDAVSEVRERNGQILRRLIEDANREDLRVIVVTNLQSPRSIQHQVQDDIAGTDYVFNEKGLVQHPNYARWVDAMVEEATGGRGDPRSGG